MTTARVIQAIRETFALSVENVAERAGVSATTVRNWLNGGGMSETPREKLAKNLKFENWGQLESFLVPIGGGVFVLKHLAKDLGRVWDHYLEHGASPIFETKIALSYERPFALGFSAKANAEARQKIVHNGLTIHRIEQPRTIPRLAELATNAQRLKGHGNYALKLVPPVQEGALFPYPNVLRFGKKVLVLGRTHKLGSPGANDPLVLIRGAAAEELGDHLENALWYDANAKVFSSLEDDARRTLCRTWANILQPRTGAAAFDAAMDRLAAAPATLDRLRI
jgi:transcriptional regulator with XRE-family HTH domain